MVLPKVSHLVNHMNFHYIMDYFLSFALEFSFGYPKTIYSCKAWGGSILVAVYAVNDVNFFFINVVVWANLQVPRLILRALKLTTM